MAKPQEGERTLAKNRKAFFQYQVTDRAEAGIALVGTEVKSIREGGLSFSDSFVEFRDGELFPYGQRALEARAVRTWDEAAEAWFERQAEAAS